MDRVPTDGYPGVRNPNKEHSYQCYKKHDGYAVKGPNFLELGRYTVLFYDSLMLFRDTMKRLNHNNDQLTMLSGLLI